MMRAAAALVLLLVGAPAAARPGVADLGGAQGLYEEGQAAALAGDQAGAAALYVRALTFAGGEHPALYHALGNALYREGDAGAALCAYARGQRLAPRDGDLAANRARVAREAPDKLDPPETTVSALFWLSFLSALEVAAAASLLATAGLGGLVWARARGRAVGLAGPAALALSAALAASVWVAEQRAGTAVVTAAEVTARSARGPDGVELFRLHAGAELRVADAAEDALLLQLPDGRKGWVPAEAACSTTPGAPFPAR
ncbi:MAG: hypothetical protein RL071_1206 [Pseudomonadota bacterium]|jgi:tetratricopeptide (TPR) repeat protein